MHKSSVIILLSICCYLQLVKAQEVYTVDIGSEQLPPLRGHLKLGTNYVSPNHTLDANSLYLLKNGRPWYPVMGEFHFSRFPRENWEASVLKMKAGGINVIATYIFWIHHEEKEGQWNWTRNNDLRYFIELCKKHAVFVWVRIGPWCHGEVRNGGQPDWLVKRGNARKNDTAYLASAKKLYTAIAQQLSGMYFKDGGPVIGAQIENEYRFNNKAGLEHMLTLKQMAVAAGIDVPYYSATAWQGANLTQNELIPVWGAYAEAPWSKSTVKLPLSENYLFGVLRNDPAIGSDLLGQRKDDSAGYKGYRYPYATAEMGGGIQITYHRRPLILPEDVTALAYVKLGSGANLMGYYMYHGGVNPIGLKSTMQESKATGYPNDYPIMNYDFQAPLGAYGQVQPSYKRLKLLHAFLQNFGDSLAQYYPYFPRQKPSGVADSTTLRFAVRAKAGRGFVIISNYQRQLQLATHKNVQLRLVFTGGKNINAFEDPLNIPAGMQAILPFNMDVGGATLLSATLQPLCKIKTATPAYIFFQPVGLQPAMVFDKKGITGVQSKKANVVLENGKYYIRNLQAGTDCVITIILENGNKVQLLVLTETQALNSWQGEAFGKERFIISPQNLVFNKGKIQLQNTGGTKFDLLICPAVQSVVTENNRILKPVNNGIFSRFNWQVPVQRTPVKVVQLADIEPYRNKGVQLPDNELNSKVMAASPGPQYSTNLQPVAGGRYWRIMVPPTKNYTMLSIDYSGDTGAAYEGGKLFADDFYYGATWPIGLPASSKGYNLIIAVVPFTAERKVYFEDKIAAGVRVNMAARLNTAALTTFYTTELTGTE